MRVKAMLVVPGANDMSRQMQYMATNGPNTRLVPGGYSLGAAVVDIGSGLVDQAARFAVDRL